MVMLSHHELVIDVIRQGTQALQNSLATSGVAG
jgi:hypothetical protein